jgi:hypothetical protein
MRFLHLVLACMLLAGCSRPLTPMPPPETRADWSLGVAVREDGQVDVRLTNTGSAPASAFEPHPQFNLFPTVEAPLVALGHLMVAGTPNPQWEEVAAGESLTTTMDLLTALDASEAPDGEYRVRLVYDDYVEAGEGDEPGIGRVESSDLTLVVMNGKPNHLKP